MIFGGTATVERYKGNPNVQAHGPGFSKIMLGDDEVDHWEKYLDLMVESIYINRAAAASTAPASGPRGTPRKSPRRSPNASARSSRCRPKIPRPASPRSPCRDRPSVWGMIEQDLKENGVTDMTAKFGPRLVEKERCAICGRGRPLQFARAASPKRNTCSRSHGRRMPAGTDARPIGPTLVCTGITKRKASTQLSDAHIDRLNIGPIPTTKLNWLQPHEGNIIDFLFRNRAYQVA